MLSFIGNSKYKVGKKIKGCTILKIENLHDIQAEMIILKHDLTGARIMQVKADDNNNLFNTFLPTYPVESNGVAHILEHTTLCGSQKYPVRDSFFSMTKRSLNTFMNAMTGADFTCYPASSMVEKDYFNLLDVYLDAIFYPNLRLMSFLQEGHRFEFEKIDDVNSPLVYKGVVYNEMKGAMSNPQSMYSDYVSKNLFPTTIYGINSGGDPEVIPSLTYENLKKFHQKYYHPSNAIFFFYGNIPLEKNIDFISKKVLNHFKKSDQLAPLPKEKRFKKPIKKIAYYPVDKPDENAYFFGLSWLTCDCTDPIEVFGMDILVSMLMDYDHSPLKLALVNSGLGIDLIDSTIDSELNEIPVTIGLKGVNKKNIGKVQKVILDVLKDLSVKGLDKDLIKTAFHSIEIQTRERHEPYGLHVSFKALLPFQRGLNPTLYLQPDTILKKLYAKIEKGGFFEGLIKKWFVNNPHRVDLIMQPDVDYRKKEEKKLRQKLDAIQKKLKANQKSKIIQDALELQTEQSKGDDQKTISLLPCLSVKDIRKNVKPYPLSKIIIKGVPFYSVNTPTNGICYIKFEFNISDLSESEKMILPILGNLLTSIGTAEKNFIELSKALNLHTGGVNVYPLALSHIKHKDVAQSFMTITCSAVYRNTEKLMSLISDILLMPSFANKSKVLEIVNQSKADLYEKINPSGNGFAVMHASRFLSPVNRLNSQWDGIEQLQFLEEYSKKIKTNYEKETKALSQLCSKIFAKNRLEIAVASEKENIIHLKKILPTWVERFPTKKAIHFSTKKHLVKTVYEGCQVNTNVAYVARVIPTVPYTHADAAPLTVLARILSSGFTHTEIREKGGAYGGSANHNPSSGLFNFVSYRDPNIVKTMQVYDAAATFVLNGGISQEQVLEGVLQTFAMIDSPHSPASKANIAHTCIKQGLDIKTRQQFRNRLLKVNLKDLQRVAKKYLLKPKLKSEAVVSGKGLFSEAVKECKVNKMKLIPVKVLK